MNLYFAPLEGITGYIYRNTHAELFGGCDAYYAPFITPVENERLNKKCLRDILPENNRCSDLRVQLLSNNPKTYFKFEDEIIPMGYSEININLGCPSGTVVKKGRGSGFLREREAMTDFFQEIFERNNYLYSVNPEKIDCDYYSYLKNGKPEFIGEYMSQYSWAESTCGLLQS